MSNLTENIKHNILINSEVNLDIRGIFTILENSCKATIVMKQTRNFYNEIHVDFLTFRSKDKLDEEQLANKVVNFLRGYNDCAKYLGTENAMDLLINRRRLEVHGNVYNFDNMTSTILVLDQEVLDSKFGGNLSTYLNNVLIDFSKVSQETLGKHHRSRRECKIYANELKSLDKQELTHNLA